MADDLEALCACGHPAKDHREGGRGSCTVIDCICEWFDGRDQEQDKGGGIESGA